MLQLRWATAIIQVLSGDVGDFEDEVGDPHARREKRIEEMFATLEYLLPHLSFR